MFAGIGILGIIWYVCIFFVPFVLIGIGKRATAQVELLTEIRDLHIRSSDDSILTDAQVAMKYQLKSNFDGSFSVGGSVYTSAKDAAQATKSANS